LLAPIWLQITHLLVAEMFWILLVLASADLLLAKQVLSQLSYTPTANLMILNNCNRSEWQLTTCAKSRCPPEKTPEGMHCRPS